MGKKSGPKAPPPPPDYSPQRDEYVKSVEAARNEQAKEYNKAINFFNKQLSGYGGTIGDIGDALSGLDIDYDVDTLSGYGDTIDNLQSTLGDFLTGDVSGFNPYIVPAEPTPPSIAELIKDPDSPYYGMDPEIVSQIQNMSFGPLGGSFLPPQTYVDDLSYDAFGLPTNPNFSVTGTSYGQAVSLATPTLNELNFAQANKFLRELAELESVISGLETGRQSELDRIKNFFSGYTDDFNTSDIDVAYDPLSTDFDKYLAQLSKAENELGGFESKLDFSADKTATLAELEELRGIIEGRQQEKAAEETRISDFGTDIDTRLDTLRDEIEALGIADVEDPSGFNDRLEAIRDEISGFDSELDFNFAGDTATAFELEDMISSLQDKRAAEEARIDNFRKQYESLLESGTKGVNRMDLYDLFAIEDAQSDLDKFIKDLQGFESELAFDFSDLIEGAADPQSVLTQLLADRTGKLTKEQADVDAILEQITGVADYDEAAMNRLKNNLIDELADLNRFTGGLDANRDSIEGGLDSIEALLDTLATKRGTIESDALKALQDARGNTFNTLDDVATAEELMNTILGQSETYKASQAQDELDLLAALLGEERARIQGDMDTVEAREQAAADEIEALTDAYGNLLFPTVADGQQDILTEEALQAYLANLDDEDELQNLEYDSSFARSLLGRGI